MHDAYSLQTFIQDLRRITEEAQDEDEIFTGLVPLAKRVAMEKEWLRTHHYSVDPEQGFGVHLLHEEPDHSLAVFVVAWQPGSGAPPHDHGTWAIVTGVEGKEHNTLYKRLDDRSVANHAHLDVKQETILGPGDVICMKSGGIHAVRNETDPVTLSLHTYGKHLNFTGRSQYDLEANARKEFIVQVS